MLYLEEQFVFGCTLYVVSQCTYCYMSLSEHLQPYRARPETSATVARSLVAGALGLQTRVSKQQREVERQKLKEARGQ